MSYLKPLMNREYERKKKIPRLPAPKTTIPVERDYLRDLIPYLKAIQDSVRKNVLSSLKNSLAEVEENRPEYAKNDAASDDVKEALRRARVQLSQQYTPDEIEMIARRKGISVSQFNQRVIQENLRRVVGIDIIFEQPWLAEELSLFTIQNSQLITSIADDALKRVETMAYEGLRAGTRYKDLADEIEHLVDPSVGNIRSRAEFIARDQVNKLNGQLSELRQTELGLSRYRWRTVGDERVRDSHREKEGNVYSWDDPPADTGHPGEDYQCRCYAEPVFEDLIPGMEE